MLDSDLRFAADATGIAAEMPGFSLPEVDAVPAAASVAAAGEDAEGTVGGETGAFEVAKAGDDCDLVRPTLSPPPRSPVCPDSSATWAPARRGLRL